MFPDKAHKADRRGPQRLRLSASQRLALLESEAQILYIAGCDIRLGNPLSGPDQRRLEQAVARIQLVLDYGR
jgi:hypothetical protein